MIISNFSTENSELTIRGTSRAFSLAGQSAPEIAGAGLVLISWLSTQLNNIRGGYRRWLFVLLSLGCWALVSTPHWAELFSLPTCCSLLLSILFTFLNWWNSRVTLNRLFSYPVPANITESKLKLFLCGNVQCCWLTIFVFSGQTNHCSSSIATLPNVPNALFGWSKHSCHVVILLAIQQKNWTKPAINYKATPTVEKNKWQLILYYGIAYCSLRNTCLL